MSYYIGSLSLLKLLCLHASSKAHTAVRLNLCAVKYQGHFTEPLSQQPFFLHVMVGCGIRWSQDLVSAFC